MTNIEKAGQINPDSLSGEHYFASLLEQGYRAQLLTDSALEQIQFACLALLAKKTAQWNSGDSSSIRVEKAQSLLASVLFTLGVQLKTYQSADDAAAAVQETALDVLYAQGRKRIDRLIKQTKVRHVSLTDHLLQTKNEFYSIAARESVERFFKLYDADFSAHEIPVSGDYPVYNETERLAGIESVAQYTEQRYYENLFCTHFSPEEIHCLLCGYDLYYESLLFNFYEPVLAASLGRVIVGAAPDSLAVTPAAQRSLSGLFTKKSTAEIDQILDLALLKLANALTFSDGLIAYAKQSLPQLAASIENGARTGTLDRVFIASDYPQIFQL